MRARGRVAIAALAGLALPCALADGVDALRGVEPQRLDAPPRLPPSLGHPLGTDALGRDVLSRVLHGGRISLAVAAAGAALSLAIGAGVGLLAGSAGGVVEVGLMRMTEAALALPKLPLLVFLGAADIPGRLGLRPGPLSGIVTLVAVVGALSWMDVARLVRAATRDVLRRDFVQAAQGLGLSPLEVTRLHVLPHLTAPLGVAFALEVGEVLLYESALSYLGLGVPPPTPSWGALLAQGAVHLYDAPHLVVVTGSATALVVAALHALIEELRVARDPASARLG